jgi:hypothetical protein
MISPLDKIARPLVTVAALGLVLPTLAALSSPASSATTAAFPAPRAHRLSFFPDFRNNVVSPLARSATAMRSYSFGALNNSVNYKFMKIDDNNGPNDTDLLGISDDGTLVGFFNPGGFDDQGFKLEPPFGQNDFKTEDVLGAASTEVTAIDGNHDLAGFWTNTTGGTFGFVKWHGVVATYSDPNTSTVDPDTEILGLNDNGIAVGRYSGADGNIHGFELNVRSGQFADVFPLGTSSNDQIAVTGINDKNDIVGAVDTTCSGSSTCMVFGFLLKGKSQFEFADPNAIETEPLGINKNDEIVGAYVDKKDNIHGFTLTNPTSNAHFQTVDDPNSVVGSGMMRVNFVSGVNDSGDLVGYYTNSQGHTHGFLAKP